MLNFRLKYAAFGILQTFKLKEKNKTFQSLKMRNIKFIGITCTLGVLNGALGGPKKQKRFKSALDPLYQGN